MLRQLQKITATVAVVLLFTACSSLRASSIAPGTSIGPPAGGAVPGGVLVASITNANYTLTDVGLNVVGSGKYSVDVYSPDIGTGFTTFVVKLAVTMGDVGRISLSNFAGFTTDVFFAGPGVNASSVTRTANGSVVGFVFDPNVLTAGSTTGNLIIRTNSTNWASGSMSIIDGGSQDVISFSPVPLPAAAWAGMALMGLIGGHKLRLSRRLQA